MQDSDDRNGLPSAGKPDAEYASPEEGRVMSGSSADRVQSGPPKSSEVEEGRRPTPVRAAMEGGDADEVDHRGDTRLVHDEEGGGKWAVTVIGRTASGILPLRTVPLLELSFSSVEEPERPRRGALTCGGDLADLSEQELLSSFKRSEPFRDPSPETNDKDPQRKRRKNRGTLQN